MAKVPTAGTVKTRLQPFFSPEQCAQLAECFLLDTVSKAECLRNQIIIAYTPLENLDILRRKLPSQKTFIEQKGASLGDRMFNAFQFAFSQDPGATVMIGTDSPTFPSEFLQQAFENLRENDAVLGETEDGGFYLIGLRTPRKEIFKNVQWSSPQTFGQTVGNIKKLGLKLSLLPICFDVDLPADVEKLRKNLVETRTIAPLTFDWLNKNP